MTGVDAEDVILQEGNEEAQYIVLEFEDDPVTSFNLAPGTALRLEGLDGDSPRVLDAQGRSVFEGRYEDSVGSLLVLGRPEPRGGAGTAALARPGQAAAGGAGEVADVDMQLGEAAGPSGGAGAGLGPGSGAGGGPQAAAPAAAGQPQGGPLQYICHTEKRLRLWPAAAGRHPEAGAPVPPGRPPP